MPNWFFTSYELHVDESKISKEEGNKILQSIYDELTAQLKSWPHDIQKLINDYQRNNQTDIKSINDLWKGQPKWLGNIFLHQGKTLIEIMERGFPCRGSIENIVFEPDKGCLFIDTDTAWQPMALFLAKYYEQYKDKIIFDYFGEEEMGIYYAASTIGIAHRGFGEYESKDMDVQIQPIQEWF